MLLTVLHTSGLLCAACGLSGFCPASWVAKCAAVAGWQRAHDPMACIGTSGRADVHDAHSLAVEARHVPRAAGRGAARKNRAACSLGAPPYMRPAALRAHTPHCRPDGLPLSFFRCAPACSVLPARGLYSPDETVLLLHRELTRSPGKSASFRTVALESITLGVSTAVGRRWAGLLVGRAQRPLQVANTAPLCGRPCARRLACAWIPLVSAQRCACARASAAAALAVAYVCTVNADSPQSGFRGAPPPPVSSTASAPRARCAAATVSPCGRRAPCRAPCGVPVRPKNFCVPSPFGLARQAHRRPRVTHASVRLGPCTAVAARVWLVQCSTPPNLAPRPLQGHAHATAQAEARYDLLLCARR